MGCFSLRFLYAYSVHLLWLMLLGSSAPGPTSAQTGMDLIGPARAISLGGATTALHDDLGAHANPATPAGFKSPAVLFFAHQAYGLAELRQGGLHAVVPLDFGSLAGGISGFGFDDYQELYASLGGARGFSLGTSRRLYAGAAVRYYRTQIHSYGHAHAAGLSLGLLVPLLPTLLFGAQAINVNGPQLGPDAPLPQVLTVGLNYQVSEETHVLIDLSQEVDFPLSVRGGLEVYPASHLALRAGVSTEPTRFSVGTGVHLGRLRADLAADHHLDLGWTPAAALGLYW